MSSPALDTHIAWIRKVSEEFPALFYEIFGRLPRQGPGGDAYTLRALKMIPNLESIRDILDMGCGSGTPTFVLARNTNANIVALDNYLPFLDTLQKRAQANGFDRRIRCVVGDMSKPEFPPGSFDLIWSEGAIAIANLTGKKLKDRAVEVVEALPLSDKRHTEPFNAKEKIRSNKSRNRQYQLA